MQRQSSPKHRHDGTSPLPLGMDWSPPPKKWAGRDTVWPHDPQTGWSYCVTIPSWVVRPKSRDSDPIVFYRVLIGIQSPEGVTTARCVLRRFNDFLKFLSALKTAFPRKNLSSAPPKGLLRMKTRALLEERRRSLEEWMIKLLSDIDISRSFVVASFLELEAAARSFFQDENQHSSVNPSANSSAISSCHIHPNTSIALLAGSSSITSDYGSDTAYETSEIGSTSLSRDNNSEIGIDDVSLDEDMTSPIDKFMKYGKSNIDELFMGQAILEQLEGFPRDKMHVVQNVVANDIRSENGCHAPKFSTESIGSDVSSQKGSESPNLSFPTPLGNKSIIDLPRGAEVSGATGILGNSDMLLTDDMQLVLPQDQGQKMNRVLMTMQRRSITAKADLEDLISRLNQEIAAKEYLTTKVKDLEVELETTKQKSKENIEQAIMIEQERVTQMQWDMEELKRKSMEMELKLKSRQNERTDTEMKLSSNNEKDIIPELDLKRLQLEDLSKRYQELEAKSKADIKILVKEVKSLRNTQAEMKKQLHESFKEKSEIEMLLQEEKHNNECMTAACRNFLDKCETLCNQLQECEVDLFNEDEHHFPSSSYAFDDSAKSDDQIDLLFAEAQDLSLAVDALVSTADRTNADNGMTIVNEDLRKMLLKIFVDNGRLRKKVNFVARFALRMKMLSDRNDSEAFPNNNVQNENLDR